MLIALKQRAYIIFGVLTTLFIVHVFNWANGGDLGQYGVIPRYADQWWHIFTAPFIHGSWAHLSNNLVGLSIFSALCLARSIRFYFIASIFIIIVSGLGVWVFARTASHIGASGWIFGLWSLSIAMAVFDRSLKNIAIALVVVFFYGGMIYGVLPSDPNISFEAHIFGVIAGILCVFFDHTLTKKNRPQAEKFDP